MKTINKFLIAFFVTAFSVGSFAQVTYTSDVTNIADTTRTIYINKGDIINLVNKIGDNQSFSSGSGNDFTKDLDEDIFNKLVTSDTTITIYKAGLIDHLVFKLKIKINTLGTNDISNIKLNIFPNPTTDFLNISGTQIKALQVFDVNGRLVLSETPNASNINLDVRSLETGFYTVLVNDQQTIRFIKE